MSKSPSLHRIYIEMTRITRALERNGVTPTDYHLQIRPDITANGITRILENKISDPSYLMHVWRKAHITAEIDGFYGDDNSDKRDAIAHALLNEFPTSVIITEHPYAAVIYENTGVQVSLDIDGGALCKRVLTGFEEVIRPDPELVAELPTVTEHRPVYEWRCI